MIDYGTLPDELWTMIPESSLEALTALDHRARVIRNENLATWDLIVKTADEKDFIAPGGFHGMKYPGWHTWERSKIEAGLPRAIAKFKDFISNSKPLKGCVGDVMKATAERHNRLEREANKKQIKVATEADMDAALQIAAHWDGLTLAQRRQSENEALRKGQNIHQWIAARDETGVGT